MHRFVLGRNSPIDLQALALIGERSRCRGSHVQRMRLLVESDGFRLRRHYCHSDGLRRLQKKIQRARRDMKRKRRLIGRRLRGSGGVNEMRATGIVGQARCDSGARMVVLGWCARRGVSWGKVGSKTAGLGCAATWTRIQTDQVMHKMYR